MSIKILNGAFILGWKIINGCLNENDFGKWIKLSEIKIVKRNDKEDVCEFSTYKDCHYATSMSSDDLLKRINMFTFKPDDFYFEYIED